MWNKSLAIGMAAALIGVGTAAAQPQGPPESPSERTLQNDNALLNDTPAQPPSNIAELREQILNSRGMVLLADPPDPQEYWLGIACTPVPEAVRLQLKLPETQGLFVKEVVPDSPAAKAGIAKHDVLMQAGGKPLADLRDLVQAVNAAKDAKLTIELIHGGQLKTVEATPAKRREAVGMMPAPGDWETMQRWLEQLQRNQTGQDGENRGLKIRIPRPGAILPPGVLEQPPLPKNMCITISKEGDQPVKIVVHRGDEKWEVSVKELDKLPADVRRHVGEMTHWTLLGIVQGPEGVRGTVVFDKSPSVAPPGRPGEQSPQQWQPPQDPRGTLETRLEKRIEAMDHRIDKLMKAVDSLIEGRPRHEAPEKPDEK